LTLPRIFDIHAVCGVGCTPIIIQIRILLLQCWYRLKTVSALAVLDDACDLHFWKEPIDKVVNGVIRNEKVLSFVGLYPVVVLD